MLPPSAAQLALTEVLRQRLAEAGCQYGRFDVSGPDAYLSLSGQKANGKTLYFWEFGPKFHQLVDAYLQEQHDEHTAQLTIQIDVAQAQTQYVRTPKQAPTTLPASGVQPTPAHDHTPYGLTLAAQVAASLDQGTALAYSRRGYGGMALARSAGAGYQYGEVWDGAISPSRTFPSWAAFVAWLAAQSDCSLAGPESYSLGSQDNQAITRQRLMELVQRAQA
jgi:hypothetical protein